MCVLDLPNLKPGKGKYKCIEYNNIFILVTYSPKLYYNNKIILR